MSTKPQVSIVKSTYGITQSGIEVEQVLVENINGMRVNIITYGGRITFLKTPDINGTIENVVLGFDSLAQYEKPNPYFGAIIGRYGNRIANGEFALSGVDYSLVKNNGNNNLHGGLKGFDKVVWVIEEMTEGDSASLKLSYLSKDMEEGFPGNLKVFVTYTLNSDNSLDVLYEATTDKTTVVNLTQHSYFNLSGDFSQTILDHDVKINADTFLPVDSGLIPNGELRPVDDTPFDFRVSKLVAKEIDAPYEQNKLGGGYDHCWVLNDQEANYRSVAKVYHSDSGRTLEVFTDQPGMQFYTGNFIDGTLPRPEGGTYARRSGLCLETQHFPDAPNKPKFPSVVLKVGEKYHSKTSFKFSTK